MFLSKYNGRREEQDTENYHQGVITILERRSEPGREGGEGMSEGSVGEVSFCYVSFRELERRGSEITEWWESMLTSNDDLGNESP